MSRASSAALSSVTVCSVALAACTFDPSAYRATGSGGSTANGAPSAGSTSHSGAGSGPSASASTSGAGGATTGATVSASSATSSSGAMSTSSTGSPLMLAPCGVPVDHFDTFPTGWNPHDATTFKYGAGNSNTGVEAKVQNQWSGAFLAPMTYSECYASIQLIDQSGGGKSFLSLFKDNSNNVDIHYDSWWKSVSWPGGGLAVAQDRPEAFGIALHAGSIYYLFIKHGSTTWTHAGKQSVSSWMSGNVGLGFGDYGQADDWTQFDDFNVVPITGADLW